MPEDRSVLDRAAPPPARTWAFGEAPDQVADLYLPEGSAGCPVFLVHGGYWRPEYDRTHLRPMAAALAAAGHPTVLAGYARVPGDPDAALADLRRALRGLGAVLPDPRPVLVGHSAGGHLALLLATDDDTPARGCLALAPVADLAQADALDLDDGAVRAFLGAPAHTRPDLDPTALGHPRVPVTVLHGTDDSLVPLPVSASYCADERARLVTMTGIGHFEPIDPQSGTWPTVLAELSALAGAAGIE